MRTLKELVNVLIEEINLVNNKIKNVNDDSYGASEYTSLSNYKKGIEFCLKNIEELYHEI